MELLPIIKASLGIFTVLLSITFMVSFIVYKIKSRNLPKPYQREPRIFDSNVILEVHDAHEEKAHYKSINQKFKVLNDISGNDNVNKVSNDPALKKIKATIAEKNTNNNISPKKSKRSQNEVFNIYRFYSNDDNKQMHKIKVKTATAE